MFEQAFKNIDDVLRKEAGCTTELDYTEQTSWLLFLKYLDGLEQDRAMEAALDGKKYVFILDESYRWESWAAPKDLAGKLDHNNAMTGDDLRDFVDRQLGQFGEAVSLCPVAPQGLVIDVERWASDALAFQPGTPHAGFNTLDNEVALQFGNRADDDHHGSAQRPAGVDVLPEGNKLEAEMVEFVEHFQEVADRASDAIESPHQHAS